MLGKDIPPLQHTKDSTFSQSRSQEVSASGESVMTISVAYTSSEKKSVQDTQVLKLEKWVDFRDVTIFLWFHFSEKWIHR